MVVMFSLRSHYKYCNELGYKSLWGSMFQFLVVLLVIGVIEEQGWCSPKGECYVITLDKNTCNKVNKGKNKTKVMGHISQGEYWEKNPRYSFGLLWLKQIRKGNGKGKETFIDIYL